jgi:hypothetical protein
MRKKSTKKLGVKRETLAVLSQNQTAAVMGGAIYTGGNNAEKPIFGGGCQASVLVCSVMETCVSCKEEGGTILVAVS